MHRHMGFRIRSLDLLHNHHRKLIHSRSLVRSEDPSIHNPLHMGFRNHSLGQRRIRCCMGFRIRSLGQLHNRCRSIHALASERSAIQPMVCGVACCSWFRNHSLELPSSHRHKVFRNHS